MLKENIVLTGATGFVGSHLLQAFVDSRRNAVIICRSFRNARRIEHLLRCIRRIDIDMQDLDRTLSMLRLLGTIHVAADYGCMRNEVRSVFAQIFRCRLKSSTS